MFKLNLILKLQEIKIRRDDTMYTITSSKWHHSNYVTKII